MRWFPVLLGLVVLLIAPYGGAGARVLQAEGAAAGGDTGGPPPPRPSTANCSELFYEEQQTNNVSGKPTWRQRYFLCDQYWDREDPYAPIFFYAGNEGNVANGVNNTGLMWERAQAFGALLVFAEHRYYGNSWPFGKEESLTLEGLQFLSMEQAIEDYVTFLNWLKISLNATSAPVVAFGGSYGGVLVAIMRATRSSSVQAAVSSSAPMRGWLLQDGGYDPGSYWEVVTRDASPAAGADPACVPNSQRLFPLIISLIESGKEASWRQVEQGLRICPGAINSSGDATMWAMMANQAFDMASMGNYPYRSAYFTGNPDFPYPAWPARVVCSQLAGSFQGDEELLAAGGAAISVIFNVTQSVPCYDYAFAQSSTSLGAPGSYSYQTCTQFQLNSIWFGTNGAPRDMFWRAATPFNRSALDASCVAAFGGVVLPHIGEMHLRYGLFPDQFAAAATNVVFSNGLLDPWGSAGYLEGLAPSLPAVVLPQGAHHVDLMFADPADPPQFAEARDEIMGHVRTWIDDWVEQQEETEQE